ncbi:histidinol-phosphatase [Neobacillus vireti LMG 21834]|uniref:Histidinol-phosphatase n=2 Tax=Neobacillus TaxID=2675232 RepID=A0AB94IS96_9BACI|nr:histidinol-phosphatase [Neobacillus vireti LMG 21834]
MVSAADIDVIAHLDLMKCHGYKEYGIYRFEDYQEIIQQILKKAIERNIGIEINSSGLRAGLKQTLPSMNIIQLYKELGGEILTIGSDLTQSRNRWRQSDGSLSFSEGMWIYLYL